MLGNLISKYSSTVLKPTLALVENDTNLFTAQNDIDIDDIDLDVPTDNSLNPQAQVRRERVLEMLNTHPLIIRALIDDHESDPLNVILTLAIRDIGTIEFMLPKASFDGIAILTCLESLQTTH